MAGARMHKRLGPSWSEPLVISRSDDAELRVACRVSGRALVPGAFHTTHVIATPVTNEAMPTDTYVVVWYSGPKKNVETVK